MSEEIESDCYGTPQSQLDLVAALPILVIGCSTCPFAHYNDGAVKTCTHPKRTHQRAADALPEELKTWVGDVLHFQPGPAPDWCPLVTSPAFVRRK